MAIAAGLGIGAAAATTASMIGLIEAGSQMQLQLAFAELKANIVKKGSNAMANSVG